MALPVKGDIRRPLYLAVRSMRLLGIVLIAFTLCVGAIVVPSLMRVNQAGAAVPFVAILGAFVYLVPGVLYLICAHQLKRGKTWAIIVGIVISSLGALLGLLSLVGSVFLFIGTGEMPTSVIIQTIIAAIFVAAFAQLIVHLSQSFRSLKHEEFSPPEQRGFEPMMAQPVVNPPPEQSSPGQ